MIPIPESHIELVSRPLGCTITTITPGGYPQTTAMWFLYENGSIKFSLLEKRRKLRNLRANPACNFFLMNPENMGNVIEVRGNAIIEPDPDKAFVTRVRAQYGADGPPSDGPGDDRWVITIDPVRINSIPRS